MGTFSALLTICAGNSPVTGEFHSQRPVTRGLMLSLIYAWTNGWVNTRDAGNLRRHRAHYDVTAMFFKMVVFVEKVKRKHDYHQNLEERDSNFVVRPVLADGIAPLGARLSARSVMTKIGPIIYASRIKRKLRDESHELSQRQRHPMQ